jgi:hypothetical protein
MRQALLLTCTMLLLVAAGREPESIIVKYDAEYGGEHLTGAIYDLWPGCYVETYTHNTWSSFITALAGGEWDMCVVAAVGNTTLDGGHYDALIDYYVEYQRLHYFDWYAYGPFNDDLDIAMGVGNPTSMSFTPDHYVWDTGHGIVRGIDPWTLDMHGWTLICYHNRYPWADARPVTGWTPSEAAGRAGFLEAENGVGVVTGLYAGFIGNGQERALWENIFEFMWGEGPGVEETSWGAIKAGF